MQTGLHLDISGFECHHHGSESCTSSTVQRAMVPSSVLLSALPVVDRFPVIHCVYDIRVLVVSMVFRLVHCRLTPSVCAKSQTSTALPVGRISFVPKALPPHLWLQTFLLSWTIPRRTPVPIFRRKIHCLFRFALPASRGRKSDSSLTHRTSFPESLTASSNDMGNISELPHHMQSTQRVPITTPYLFPYTARRRNKFHLPNRQVLPPPPPSSPVLPRPPPS